MLMAQGRRASRERSSSGASRPSGAARHAAQALAYQRASRKVWRRSAIFPMSD
jgi:hypothetical protein